jgi:hypothetical protein
VFVVKVYRLLYLQNSFIPCVIWSLFLLFVLLVSSGHCFYCLYSLCHLVIVFVVCTSVFTWETSLENIRKVYRIELQHVVSIFVFINIFP